MVSNLGLFCLHVSSGLYAWIPFPEYSRPYQFLNWLNYSLCANLILPVFGSLSGCNFKTLAPFQRCKPSHTCYSISRSEFLVFSDFQPFSRPFLKADNTHFENLNKNLFLRINSFKRPHNPLFRHAVFLTINCLQFFEKIYFIPLWTIVIFY